MRKIAFLLGFALLILLSVKPAHAQDKLELFGGYSYARVPVQVSTIGPLVATPGTCPSPICPGGSVTTEHPSLSGWEVSGTYKTHRWLGWTADFSGHYGSTNGASVRLNSYLFGPQVSFPASVSPFVHALIGAARESIGNFSSGVNAGSGNTTAFAAAFGAGIDVKAAPFVSVRLIQVDSLVTRFGGETQSQPRVSAGLVLRF